MSLRCPRPAASLAFPPSSGRVSQPQCHVTGSSTVSAWCPPLTRGGHRRPRKPEAVINRLKKDQSMSDATIVVTGLRKRFGPTLALDGMSFAVQAGQVTGFVGPNGAGKSTTMRVILGLEAAEAGHALIAGRPYRSLRRPLCHLGSLLDPAALQPSRTARNHLLWLAHSQGLTARRVDEVIEQVGLQAVA